MGKIAAIERFPTDVPLVKSMLDSDWIYNIAHEQAADLADLLISNGIFLCVPLRFESHLEGFVALGNSVHPDETLIYEDYDLMRVLGRQATSALLSVKLSSQLYSAQEMAAIGKVSTFIMHDLKNHVTNLSLILSNAREYIGDPTFQREMLENLSGTLVKMKNLILRLQKIGDKSTLQLTSCDLFEIARRGAQMVGLPATIVKGESVFVAVDKEEIEKVVVNLLVNAKESGSSLDALSLEVGCDNEAFIKVTDRGCGINEDFLKNEIFKPFKSTKQRGFGIGLYQCRQIIEAHHGTIEVQSTFGKGATFTVHLPIGV